jgi:hypothetical protein
MLPIDRREFLTAASALGAAEILPGVLPATLRCEACACVLREKDGPLRFLKPTKVDDIGDHLCPDCVDKALGSILI